MAKQINVPPVIPVPSADLINYRFDQTDKRFGEMADKLDTILMQNAKFLTEEEARAMTAAAVAPVLATINNYRWHLRAIFSAATLAFFTAVAAFMVSRR